jgi:hypothetical protein
MSWWTNVRDTVESPFKRIGDIGGGLFNRITGRPNAAQQRAQQQQIQDQIKAYQDQTALERKQLDEARMSEETQKRQIQQKQIRNLRRNYRSPVSGTGLLGQGQPVADDVNQQLGG